MGLHRTFVSPEQAGVLNMTGKGLIDLRQGAGTRVSGAAVVAMLVGVALTRYGAIAQEYHINVGSVVQVAGLPEADIDTWEGYSSTPLSVETSASQSVPG